MTNTLKVASWEIKKNLTNKSFLISIILTPLMMIIFGGLPSLLSMLEFNQVHTLYVRDEIGIYQELEASFNEEEIKVLQYDGTIEDLRKEGKKARTSYLELNEEAMASNRINLYTLDDAKPNTSSIEAAVNQIIENRKMSDLGLSNQQIQELREGYSLNIINAEGEKEDFMRKIIPAIFAAIIYFSIFISGSMTFQSATQEKKDKMVEVLMSSVTPRDLMQGKIIGCFVLGMIQVLVWLAVGIPIAYYLFDIPVFQLLAIKELPIMLLFALLGYLLYFSMFVSLGSTIEDPASAGNFQGMIFILPMLPFMFFGPILANPHGIVAKIGTYFPFSTPGVMLVRITLANQVPAIEIILSLLILCVTTYFVMKLAGKLFKTAILMYGKNATPQEIMKWLRH
ncbi:ABC transporter permease [Alkaliphilus serpentinus]|uniref:ABC transporter permease n=1 Tax=Alkaliphilus serpentinus TaxID=1482731 RepID=A0A833HQD5_9FIRM|nr:ABC transporter permease [Alkaliphilus serpentinus]KAB3531572.1 ABC transporter permease [Alkaliphilus serpentinus]